MISKGTYGKVYPTDDPDIVYKSFAKDKDVGRDSGIMADFVRETCIYNMLKHSAYIPKVVSITDKRFNYSERPRIYMERCTCSLEITNYRPISEIRDILYNVMCALYDMHSLGIAHRDIKPANILMSPNGSKLCDFGISRINVRHGSPSKTYVVQTLWYRAPEVILFDNKYDCKMDMWSVGILMYELYNRKHMLESTGATEHICKIFDTFGLPNEDDWPELAAQPYYGKLNYAPTKKIQLSTTIWADADAQDLFEKLTHLNPHRRSSVFEVINHKYFRKCSEFAERPIKFILNEYYRLSKPFPVTHPFATITFDVRKKIFEWLVISCNKLKLQRNVITHTFILIDKYMTISKMDTHMDEDEYKLMCAVCVMIVSKLMDRIHLTVADIYYLMYGDLKLSVVECDEKTRHIYLMEKNVMKDMNYDIFFPDEYAFVRIITEICELREDDVTKILNIIIEKIINDQNYRQTNILHNVVNVINKYFGEKLTISVDDLFNVV